LDKRHETISHPVVNFTQQFTSSFFTNMFAPKKSNPNCWYRKAAQKHFGMKKLFVKSLN